MTGNLCSRDECTEVARCRGFCHTHYEYARTHDGLGDAPYTHHLSPDLRRKGVRKSARFMDLWSHYRVSEARYNEMLESQGGRCAACGSDSTGSSRDWHVDHDHTCCPGNRSCGECVRALLCYHCNLTISMAREDVQRLSKVISYLLKVNAPQFVEYF